MKCTLHTANCNALLPSLTSSNACFSNCTVYLSTASWNVHYTQLTAMHCYHHSPSNACLSNCTVYFSTASWNVHCTQLTVMHCYHHSPSNACFSNCKSVHFYTASWNACTLHTANCNADHSPSNACLSNCTVYFSTASWNTAHNCSKTAFRAHGRDCSSTMAHSVFSTKDRARPLMSSPDRKDCTFCFKPCRGHMYSKT